MDRFIAASSTSQGAFSLRLVASEVANSKGAYSPVTVQIKVRFIVDVGTSAMSTTTFKKSARYQLLRNLSNHVEWTEIFGPSSESDAPSRRGRMVRDRCSGPSLRSGADNNLQW